MKRIGILGFGNMGEAITGGILKAHTDAEITVYDRSDEKRKRSSSLYGAGEAFSLKELFSFSDTVIIAVKPQDAEALLKEISSLARTKKIITIIAGMSINVFAESLKTDNICRFMPNIAALCGKSLTAVSFHENAAEDFIPEAVAIAESTGNAFILPEKYMPSVTALSGSGIAFVFQFIHALSMGGVRAGLSYQDSLRITISTVEGALETLKSSGKNPMDMVTSVASPSGTTIEGIMVLEEKGFNAAVMEAVSASYKRALEIEGIA